MSEPRLIPVVDVMGGLAVRAVGGRRSEYRPVESVLTTSTDPVDVAAAMCAATGVSEVYVADLDAIRGGGLSPAVRRLLSGPDRFWVDAGPAASELPDSPNIYPVVGFESARTSELLSASVRRYGDRVAFSLDLSAGVLFGNWQGWKLRDERDVLGLAGRAVECGARSLIVLDLARVGEGRGPGTEDLCRELRRAFPGVDLIAGGGVRDRTDVIRLGQTGADGVLLASVVHAGSLTLCHHRDRISDARTRTHSSTG